VAGGAIGGFFFSFIAEWLTSAQGLARLLSLMLIGVGTGAAIGLIEVARRQAWLKVVAGGMTGKEFILYHPATVLGSSPKAQITLIKDPTIAPMHVRIDEQGARRSLTVLPGCAATVNGLPVQAHWLRDGDVISLGATAVHYQERSIA